MVRSIKRHVFAMFAMQALISRRNEDNKNVYHYENVLINWDSPNENLSKMAKLAYRIADAMIESAKK